MKTQTAAHTDTPLKIDPCQDFWIIRGNDINTHPLIAKVYEKHYAEKIVLAVNAHQELVEALNELHKKLAVNRIGMVEVEECVGIIEEALVNVKGNKI